jgi:hypothetical protein
VGAQRATTGRWEPVGVVGVATTGGAPRGLPRDQACEPDGDRALALPGRKAYPGGVASAHGGAERWRVLLIRHGTGKKEGSLAPCERRRARAWVHGYANRTRGARVCTPAPRPSLKVRTAAATRRPPHEQKEGNGRLASCARVVMSAATATKKHPSTARRPCFI